MSGRDVQAARSVNADLIHYCMNLRAKEQELDRASNASGAVTKSEAELRAMMTQIQEVVTAVTAEAFVQKIAQDGAVSAPDFSKAFIVDKAAILRDRASGLIDQLRAAQATPAVPARSLLARTEPVAVAVPASLSKSSPQPLASVMSQFADLDLTGDINHDYRRGSPLETKYERKRGQPEFVARAPEQSPVPGPTYRAPAVQARSSHPASAVLSRTVPDFDLSAFTPSAQHQPAQQPRSAVKPEASPAPSVPAVVESRSVVQATVSPLMTARVIVVHGDAASIKAAQFGEAAAVQLKLEGRTAEEALQNAIKGAGSAKLLVINPYSMPGASSMLHREVGQTIQRVLATGIASNYRVIIAVPTLKTEAARNDLGKAVTGAIVVNKANQILNFV